METSIRRLDASQAAAAIPRLCEVLIDCVDGGASVSFMAPLTPAKARAFWTRVAEDVARGERVLLGAFEAERLIGTVQLHLALPENQPHRADLAKLLVHRDARRRGVAERLMAGAEAAARAEQRTLLVLDAVTGGDAERLYTRLGWQRVGVIPHYALFPDGRRCSTTYFFKAL